MGERTGIAWCDHTFNPWIGCTRVGPGCDHCYAEEMDRQRFSRHLDGGTREHPVVHWGPGAPRHRTTTWNDPLRWNNKAAKDGLPHRVFCASLADVFDNEIPEEWRAELAFLIQSTPHLSWLLVTKRIGNVKGMWGGWVERGFPKNVRLLITICDQEEADRDIPKLLALPCKNGISYEPALGPVDWTRLKFPSTVLDGFTRERVEGGTFNGFDRSESGDWKGIEWIIVGGESQQGKASARPFDLAWARSTIAQCRAAGVPVFVKQLGSDPWFYMDLLPGHHALRLKDRAGADPAEWPEDLRVREFPEANERQKL